MLTLEQSDTENNSAGMPSLISGSSQSYKARTGHGSGPGETPLSRGSAGKPPRGSDAGAEAASGRQTASGEAPQAAVANAEDPRRDRVWRFSGQLTASGAELGEGRGPRALTTHSWSPPPPVLLPDLFVLLQVIPCAGILPVTSLC